MSATSDSAALPTNTASFRPNEDSYTIESERTWLQGMFLTCIIYGISTVLYFMSANLLWAQRRQSSLNYWLLGYITTIFLLSTAFTAGDMQFTQQAFIDDRNIPGGPSAYEVVEYNVPIDMVCNATLVIIAVLADAVNIWRCSVIYRGSRRFPWWAAITLPVLMYLAAFTLGVLWLHQVGAANPYATSGINWTTPYFSTSLALNILVTILIVARLLFCRARVARAMGNTHGRQYTSLAAMIIESAAIYSTFSLLFLVPFAINTPTSILPSQTFLQSLSPVQVLSTLLIIFRVAQGKSWSLKTSRTITEHSGVNATRTIGGTSVRREGVRVDTNIATHTDSNHVVSLKSFGQTGSALETKDYEIEMDSRAV